MAAPVMVQDTVAAIMAVDMAAATMEAISSRVLPLPRAVGRLQVIIHPRAAGHHKAITTDTANLALVGLVAASQHVNRPNPGACPSSVPLPPETGTGELAAFLLAHRPAPKQTALRVAGDSGGCVRAALADLESWLDSRS